MIIGITFRANMEVDRCFVSPAGTKRFRNELGIAGGGFHYQRLLLESALKHGLLQDLPEHSTVQIAHVYPFWYDANYSKHFFAAYAGKSLNTVPPSPTVAQPQAGPDLYQVRDELLRPDAGYVVLSRLSSQPDAKGLRLFIRYPTSSRGPRSAFPAPRKNESGVVMAITIDGHDLPMIRSGHDWALLSLDDLDKPVDHEMFQAMFNPALLAPRARTLPTVAEAVPDSIRR
jgi:hypothetical protein